MPALTTILLDDLGLRTDSEIDGRTLLGAVGLVMRRVRALIAQTADIRFGTVVGSDPGPPRTLAVEFADGSQENCRYLAASAPSTGDRVAVVEDDSHSVVIGRLA